MLRVYLDTNHWVSLARADHDRPNGAAFRDVLAIAAAGSQMRIASFPLSIFHYGEVWKHNDPERRWRLAQTMSRLSRLDSVAALGSLLPGEFDAAFKKRFGRPLGVRSHPAFGRGLAHASGRENLRFRAPTRFEGLPPTVRQDPRDFTNLAMLAGPPVRLPIEGLDTDLFKQPANAYQEAEEKQAEEFQESKADRETREGALTVSALLDIKDPVLDACHRAGIEEEELIVDLEAEGLTSLLRDIPTRWVDHELRRLRHENAQMGWNRGDLADMNALSVAIIYCDVVVTERRWTHLAARADLGERYGTKIFSSLEDLQDLLLRAAA